MAEADTLTRFLIDRTAVRGVHVRLAASWTEVRARAPAEPAAERLLGEALAATSLFCGHLKVEGRISLQLRGSAGLRTLFAECTSAGTLRGIARGTAALPPGFRLRDAGEDALLALTIETRPPGQREAQRYQGLVGLAADTLEAALVEYFRQSEQLPTVLLLAADQGHAAGLMLQVLPGSDGGADWERALALSATLGHAELLATPGEELLWRLFHEDGVRLLSQQPLAFGCSCSQARVEAMLVGLGRDEALAAATGGAAEVQCEFCGKAYRLPRASVAALFDAATPAAPAPPGLH
jgi:molecular chaperone Hsp33